MKTLTEYAIAFGTVVATKLAGASRAVLANLAILEDEDGAEGEGGSEEPLYGPWGWFGRPKPPDDEGEAEAVLLRLADLVVPLVGRDLRLSKQVNPKDGEVGLIQYGGGFVSLADNADGNGTAITIYALRKNPDGSPDKASVIALDSAAGNASISILHESGTSFSINKDGAAVVMNKTGDAILEVNDAGITLSGAQVIINGGVVLGTQNPDAPGVEALALAQKVALELTAIKSAFDGHTHPSGALLDGTSTPVTGATAPPAAPMPTPGSVAATNAKAL